MPPKAAAKPAAKAGKSEDKKGAKSTDKKDKGSVKGDDKKDSKKGAGADKADDAEKSRSPMTLDKLLMESGLLEAYECSLRSPRCDQVSV